MQSLSNRSVVIISGLLTLLVLGSATLAVGFRNGWLQVATHAPGPDGKTAPAPDTVAEPSRTPLAAGGGIGPSAPEACPEQSEVAVYRQKLEDAYRALDDAYAQVRSLQAGPAQVASRDDQNRPFTHHDDRGERGSRRPDFDDD